MRLWDTKYAYHIISYNGNEKVAGSLAALFRPEDNLLRESRIYKCGLEKKKLLGALSNTHLSVEAHVMILCSCA